MLRARNIAVSILKQIQSTGPTLDQLLDRAEGRIQNLDRADRALFHAIVYGVLRWQGRIDWLIDNLVVRPDKKIDPLVRIILRIGLFQMHFLDRIPPSAAVHTCVELTKINRRRWASGFVNGVLRRAANQKKKIPWPDSQKDRVAYLAAYYSFPKWLIARWIDQWGMDAMAPLCDTINTIPRITIRTNTLMVSRPVLEEGIQSEVKRAITTIHSPDGISFSSPNRPIYTWEAFQKGWFQVQGEAAQCIAHCLSVHPGQNVWDACSGLGTKTAHIAQIMENKGRILATDISQTKLNHLATEMHRLGVTITEPLQLDLTQPFTHLSQTKFDRILVDAPCSGLGVLQKNPDGKWRSIPEEIEKMSHRQLILMESCAPYLKNGGLMVYAVCSFEPEENEHVIKRFLQKHPEFVIEHAKLEHIQNIKAILTPEGFLKTVPHQHQLDGFFAAVLKKQ